MQGRRNSNRFPSVFLIVGVAMAAVVPAVRVSSTEKRHAPQRVALIAPGSESNVAQQVVIKPENTPEPRTLIAPGSSRPDPQAPPAPTAQPGEIDVVHVGRVISGTPVPSKGGNLAASRAAGGLGLGDPCSCDEDCGAFLGDQCNIVQCIVRSFCAGDPTVPCSLTEDCEAVGAGTCTPEVPNCDSNEPPNCNFVQRCDLVQLFDWPCDADAEFCTSDRCDDDGTGTGHSVCVAEDDGSGSPLSPCAKQCVGGPSTGLRCSQSSDCSQGSCQITAGGGCDSAAEACYVGTSLATAVGRCCNAGACTETDEATCTGGGGAWYRYRNPEDQEGDGNCLCPKYGSGVAPSGDDLGTEGLVRPSGLICGVASVQTNTMVYCEDADGDGFAPKFCQKRCVRGDNEGAPCTVDNPDCGRLGACSIGGTFCLVENGGEDCGLCEGLDDVGCDDTGLNPCPGGETCLFDGDQTCPPIYPGQCQDDLCASNTIEGGCDDGFLNIGDDYFVENGSYLRLSQFRFRGGISNLGEDFVIEFWDSTGTRLVDAFAINDLPLTGTHDWTIEVDCFPNCNPVQLEVPEQRPIIIPPTGYVVMRSPRTVGTINGAAAFWEQTNTTDVGSNDNGRSWVNNDPNGSLGTNVFIFELVGSKVADPRGACCHDAFSCEDTLRWECGICTGSQGGQLCASTLHDCPVGGLQGGICQFNNWFGPISHTDFEFGGAELTLCDGISPCNRGACCVGESCTVDTEDDCNAFGGEFQGIATDCTPNCCPVDRPSGSDCVCDSRLCVVDADGSLTIRFCSSDFDCDPGQSCILQCIPADVTQLRHPYECHDDFGSPLEPLVDCDPANGNADCDEGANETCLQSFTGAFVVARNDTIDAVESLFISDEGETCSLNTAADRVGWYELINLPDPTPGDGSDDCYILTVGLCCTDPLLTPVWPFLSSFRNCPCVETADVIAQAPNFDIAGNQLDGFGPNSRANLAGRCEDGNYSATFTVPPGEYAYQISADTSCAGSAIPCDTDDDCPGSSCVLPNPDYSVVFTTESCDIAACCVDDTCILTNELDCAAQEGTFLGGGDQPVVTCQAGACVLGVCCVDGTCKGDESSDELAECEGQGGTYLGGVDCDSGPCPACPFNTSQNCQQVQTIFGAVPLMDRNPANGSSDGSVGTVQADDVKFGGAQVDQICWNTGFFVEPCCANGNCVQNVDTTWQIRVYDTDPDCNGFPGTQIGMSTITVLNKIEGTGQATGTWHYAGSLDSAITLPNGGIAGDTYWFEVSGFGDSGCGVRATWSRDHGNEHTVQARIATENEDRDYNNDGVNDVDVGFCEDSGILNPGVVLGSCCICPGTCQENFTQRECGVIRGVWLACATCAETTCGGAPANDNCEAPFLVGNVPESLDGRDVLTISNQENICANDDGPGLSADPDTGGCSGSLEGGADMHNDVWYEYVATACGDLTIESCDAADMDQMIAIYDATNGCPLTDAEELTCGDDTCGLLGRPATVTLRVFAGQELLIRVGGWNDEVAGGFNGDPRGTFDLNWSLKLTCSPVGPPIRAEAPHDILKNRYISIDPRGVMGSNPSRHHIRVVMVSSQVNCVTALGRTWWAGPPDAGCISVLSHKPASEPDWSGCPTVHLTGCPIIPTTTYAIAVESGGELSAEVLLDTQAKPGDKWHGDCVGHFDGTQWTPPNGAVSIDDAFAALKTFQQSVARTHVSVTDVHPVFVGGPHPNRIVGINDVATIILGFQGSEYAAPDISLCPGGEGGGGGNPCPRPRVARWNP